MIQRCVITQETYYTCAKMTNICFQLCFLFIFQVYSGHLICVRPSKKNQFPVPDMGYFKQQTTPARRPLVRRAIELNVPVQLDTEKDEEALIPIMECDNESNLSYTGYIGPRLVTTYIHITKNSEISKLVFAG